MESMDYAKAAGFMQRIAVQAGKITLRYFSNPKVKYTKKHIADVVTEADLRSNRLIVGAIRKSYPSHGIISEEIPERTDREYTWIIDPLDGSRNFSTKTPYFCVLIALKYRNDIVMSAAYVPYFEQLYFARKGKGAFLNGRRIHCSGTSDFVRSYGAVVVDTNRDFFPVLLKSCNDTDFWVNDFGSLAVDALFTADGRRDWFFAPKAGGVWDYAAPYLILKEAGCRVTNLDFREWKLTDMDMLAANPRMYREVRKVYMDYREA